MSTLSQKQATVDPKILEAAKKQNEQEAKLAEMLGQGDARALKLVGGSVSRDTFMDAVKENMETFGLSSDQAIAEAEKEFKILGVDVSNLVAAAKQELTN